MEFHCGVAGVRPASEWRLGFQDRGELGCCSWVVLTLSSPLGLRRFAVKWNFFH